MKNIETVGIYGGSKQLVRNGMMKVVALTSLSGNNAGLDSFTA